MKGLALLPFVFVANAAFAQDTPIDTAYARSYFEELARLGRADGGQLWGVAIAGPMMFADARTRTVVANMPDTLGLLRDRNGVWVGALTPEQNVANTSVHWGGRNWSMVMWPVSDSRYARQRLLMHESYHRIQEELGLRPADQGNAHLGNVDARIWTRLEWRALTEALLRDGEERREALKDALTFRAQRRLPFKNAAEDERRLELNEGLAEYTGLVLSGLPRSALPDRAAVQLAQYEQQESFARSFAYASGPAYALLLDLAGKPWRKQLNEKSDLSMLAGEAYDISGVDAAAAGNRVTRYSGQRMIADERAREAQRAANVARLRARLIDGPVLILPAGKDYAYSFDPNGATPIPDVGTVFESSRVNDEWGVLDVSAGGVLMVRTNGNITSIAVPLVGVNNPPTKGEGWALQLAAGWTLRSGARAGDWVVARQ